MKQIVDILQNYFELFPSDQRRLEGLMKQVQNGEDLFDRRNFSGHIVANALVINAKDQILTVFHNQLKMYIQPGGHVEAEDATVWEAAQRELKEETGLTRVDLEAWTSDIDIPIFIESHSVPANSKKGEEDHDHHDFMYVFRTLDEKIFVQLEEVSSYRWIDRQEFVRGQPNSFLGTALRRLERAGF